MRQDALLVIYGGASSQAQLKAKVKTTVVLEKGAIRGGLGRMDREAGLAVETPSASITLQSPLSQVEVDALKTSIVSVYEGLARVLALGARVTVPKDHGTWVERGKRPATPVPLPPAPSWDASALVGVVVVPEGQTGAFEARWKPVARAARYRVELAEDERFTKILVDAEVGAGITRFQARDLAPGRFFARVATMDVRRLEGRPSALLTMDVVKVATSRRLQQGADGAWEAVGLLLVQPPAALAGSLEVSLDGEVFRTAETPLRLHRAGLHRIRYRRKGEPATTEMLVRLLAVTAELGLPKRAWAEGDPPLTVTATLTDERGRPASLPGLALATSSARIPMTALGPGRFAAKLPKQSPWPLGGSLPVAIHWAAGLLAQGRVVLAQPKSPPDPRLILELPPSVRPPTEAWEPSPPAIEWARGGPGQPSLGARPQTHLGLTTFVAESGSADRDLYARSSLRGGLSLLKGRLGLSLDLPWWNAPVAEDPGQTHKLGDLRLAALGVAYEGHGLTLSPALRLTAPTGGFPRTRRGTALEPVFVLEWSWRERLALGTQQGLVADFSSDRETALLYVSGYRAAWRPLDWLSLGPELGLAVGLLGPAGLGDVRALSMGGALHLLLGRFRLGLAAGGALNDDARRLLGRYTAGLTLDLLYRGL
jgi:hypothetical protein